MNKTQENKFFQHLDKYIEILIERLEKNNISFEEWCTCYREFEGSLLINKIQKERTYKFVQALINSNVVFNNKIEQENIIVTKKNKIKKFILVLNDITVNVEKENSNLMEIYKQINNETNKKLVLAKK